MENASTHETASTFATRRSLLARVQGADVASWREFYQLYRKLIHGFARRAGLSHEDAEDVTQDVFKRVAATIQRFELDPACGSFRGWLMQLTRWRIADQFARRPPTAPPGARRDDAAGPRTATIERVPAEIDDGWELDWQQHVLSAACERIARRAKPRHYQIFDLYVRRGWPVLKVAAELRTDPATIYMVGHRLKRQLKAEVEKLKTQWE